MLKLTINFTHLLTLLARASKVTKIPFVDAVVYLALYLYRRSRQLSIYSHIVGEILGERINAVKEYFVRRMFWGRGSLYKSSFHILVIIITGIFVLSGISSRIGAQNQYESLTISYGISTNDDLIQQGGTLTSVVAIDQTQPNYKVEKHVVQEGQTLQQIADAYGVSKDTIKWANDKLLSPFNDNVRAGWELLIPEMNGVLYTAKKNDTVDSVVALTSGNRFDIIELNNLIPPSYGLTEGQKVFIPDGTIKPPPPPPPQPGVVRYPGGGGYISPGFSGGALGDLPAGTFDDPLSHTACAGYRYERGFYPGGHDGVDLSHGGCPIRAVAAGTVTYVGYGSYGEGYMVKIDHGGGVESIYMHGDGNIWVRRGDYVYKGQDIMFMGATGNATGIHLHLALRLNGTRIDPAPYVPYRRP